MSLSEDEGVRRVFRREFELIGIDPKMVESELREPGEIDRESAGRDESNR